jgi:hypothetical protein
MTSDPIKEHFVRGEPTSQTCFSLWPMAQKWCMSGMESVG